MTTKLMYDLRTSHLYGRPNYEGQENAMAHAK